MAILLRSVKGSALTHPELDANFTTLQDALLDSGDVTSIAQASDIAQGVSTNLNQLAGDSDIDFGSNKILYSNNYDSTGSLPSASTYHGMFAHVHDEGRGYFAHGGNWVGLANKTEGLGGLDGEYNNGAVIDVTGDGSDFFKREVTTNGVRIMGAGTVGGQTAVPDPWLEKVGRMFELFTDPTGVGINESNQRGLIKTLSGDIGTYHVGKPTIQRVARGAGADYSPNFLTDSGIASWNLTNLFDNTVQNDMVWYLNSTGSGYGDGDQDAQEVIEHVFHTLHMHGLPADDIKLYEYLDSNWATGDLYAAMEEAYDAGKWDPSGYGGVAWKTDANAYEVAAKEYLYLLNFCMFEYTSLWDGGSLAPEWTDDMRTQAGIQANNPLGYAFHNTWIAPVISKPSIATIQSIFQDGNTPAQDDPRLAGDPGYVVDFPLPGFELPITALIDSDYVGDRIGSIGTHSDVNISGIANNQILKWDSAQQLFIAASDVSGGGGGGGLTYADFSVSVAAAGSANLAYNNATGVTTYTPPDLSSYLTSYTETNDLSAAVTWANIPDANVPESAVTQHASAINIGASQVTSGTLDNTRVAQSNVTQHQAALSITESQISDFGSYVGQGQTIDMNGTGLVLDIDGDTSLHASTDDQIDIKIGGTDVGYFDSTGLVVDNITTTDPGTPTIQSSSSIAMNVGTSVIVGQNGGAGGGFRLANITTTQRNALSASNGEMIYNTTNNQIEIDEHSAWHPMTKGSNVFNVTSSGSSDYVFTDPENHWFTSSTNDPVLYLRRGETYYFEVNASSHPFEIRTSNGGSAYAEGITGNTQAVGTVIFKVPMGAPATLYYQCTVHSAMGNTINIV